MDYFLLSTKEGRKRRLKKLTVARTIMFAQLNPGKEQSNKTDYIGQS